MTDLIVPPDFWVSRIFPEGIVERWLVPDGADVRQKQPLAELRIEGELISLEAPIAGRLVIGAKVNGIVEPGSVVGYIE